MIELHDKILLFSDFHGRKDAFLLFKEKLKEEKPDFVILLGDIYAYGPRNGRPADYDPWYVQRELFALKKKYKLLGVKGNCDDTDEYLPYYVFPCLELKINGIKTIAFHGDDPSIKAFKGKTYDLYMFGHTHLPLCEIKDDKIYLNPGSIGFPKGGHVPTYIEINKKKIILKTLKEGKIEKEIEVARWTKE